MGILKRFGKMYRDFTKRAPSSGICEVCGEELEVDPESGEEHCPTCENPEEQETEKAACARPDLRKRNVDTKKPEQNHIGLSGFLRVETGVEDFKSCNKGEPSMAMKVEIRDNKLYV